MITYTLKRIFQVIPVLLGTTLILFIALHLLPGDPVRTLAGDRPLNQAAYLEIKKELGLDKSLPEQYLSYLTKLTQGDLGRSYQKNRAVSEIIGEKYQNSLKLAAVAILFELFIGILAGILAARRQGKFIDALIDLSTLILMSIPVFFLGSILQFYLGLKLPLFPIAGMGEGGIIFYILPALTLASASIAILARLLRAEMIEQSEKNYVLIAKLKGASDSRVILRHIMPNAMIPVITFIGIDLGNLIGGAVITEGIFNWPGVGYELFTAIGDRDHPIIFGIIIVLVAVVVFLNLIVDLLHAYFDPTVRYNKEPGL